MRQRTFLLSPANCSGRRGQLLRQHAARGGGDGPPGTIRELAARLAQGGAPVGEVFAFISGLYFRGKLTYARAFTHSAAAFVITPSRGLLDPETLITPELLEEFAETEVDPANAGYREPLDRDLRRLLAAHASEVVLFGSIATGKYVDVLLPHLAERLMLPEAFIGRGDMSRGGLMLRAAAAREELVYIPVAGAIRRGTRPPKLAPLPG